MLSSLLPGFRQIRSPLVAGALTLACFYFLAFNQLRNLLNAVASTPQLMWLDPLVSPSVVLGLLAVPAYILGDALIHVMTYVDRAITTRTLLPALFGKYLERRRWWRRVLAPFSRPSSMRLLQRCGGDENLARLVAKEIMEGGGIRLLVANKDLFLEYDRLKSEVEFRLALCIPGFCLLNALPVSFGWSPVTKVLLLFLSLLMASSLFAYARVVSKQQHSLLAHAVADRITSTAALDAAASN